MEYEVTRTRSGATLTLGDEYRLEANRPTFNDGNVKAALSAYNGAIVFTDNVNLTSSRSRSAFLKKLAEKYMTVEESALMALEQACRVAPVTDVADSQGVGESEYKGPSGDELLVSVAMLLGRFIAYPSEATWAAHVLWIAHTHLMDAWDSTPRIAFLSPEKGSGKTRALEVTELLVPNPVRTMNASPAYVIRKVNYAETGLATIMLDETDTVFSNKATEGSEDLRSLVNAGHRKGAVAGRSTKEGKLVEFEAYCAVALAGIGDLPDTILARSVIVPMRRRSKEETVEPFRVRLVEKDGHQLRDQLAAWAKSIEHTIGNPWPDMPDGIEDRDEDVWEALLAIADAAGGDWPQWARSAAVELVTTSQETSQSLKVRLLEDLRTIFGAADTLTTKDIIEKLNTMDEAPWSEVSHGKPLNARWLASHLRPFGVRSNTIRVGSTTPKGYYRAEFTDTWTRYLSQVPEKSETSATSATSAENPSNDVGFNVADTSRQSATQPELSATLPQHSDLSATENPSNDPDVADVADVADFAGKEPTQQNPHRDIMGEVAALNEKLAAVRTLDPDAPWDCHNCGKTNFKKDSCSECGAPRPAEAVTP